MTLRIGSRWGLVAAMLLGACSGGDLGDVWSSGAGRVAAEPATVVFRAKTQAEGAETQVVRVKNTSWSPATVLGASVEDALARGGRLSLARQVVQRELQPGDELAVEVRFEPSEELASGCDFYAAARLTVATTVGPLHVPLLQRGHCEDPLLWAPRQVRFSGCSVWGRYTKTLMIANPGGEDVVVDRVALAPSSASAFLLVSGDAGLPRRLAPGAALSVVVEYTPTAPEAVSGSVAVALEDGRVVAVALEGEATRKRPLCSDGIPPAPAPVVQGSDYTIEFSSPTTQQYSGTVRVANAHDQLRPAVADVLLSGPSVDSCPFAYDPIAHSVRFGGVDCSAVRYQLLFPVPVSEEVGRWLGSVEIGDTVQIVGYPITKIQFDDRYAYASGSASYLQTTWVCDP